MNLPFTIEIWPKDSYVVAKCPELDCISQGRTVDEAKKNLLEAIEIQFEEMATMGKRMDSDKRHELWQSKLDEDSFFEKVFSPEARNT